MGGGIQTTEATTETDLLNTGALALYLVKHKCRKYCL